MPTLHDLLLFFHSIALHFHFLSCIVLFCCTVLHCLFSFLIFSLLATSSINLNLNGLIVVTLCAQIQIYKPNNGKGCSLSPQPPPPPALGSVHLKHFTLEALPRKHWRKYSYASLFVSNIRAKTPKVTLYTHRAKFQVMENSDVEVTFYDGELCFVVFSL